ncbi:MAG: hypothetical protein K2N67_05005 [Mucispirillum sp.]|nr:hypothetical protein [Mucispirillum sp.]
MDGNKVLSAINAVMLSFLIILGVMLAIVVFLSSGSSFFSGSKDEHGCKSNEGYAWSRANQKCIKVFEEAAALSPAGQDNTGNLKAFLIYSPDNSSADIMLPARKRLFLTKDNDSGLLKDETGEYTVLENDGRLSLFQNNKEIYFLQR